MDITDCTGRTVSLLNDSSDIAPSKPTLPSLSVHSRESSCNSTPSLSPSASTPPQLARSSSSDWRAFSTPSPLTPAYGSFEQAAHKHYQHVQSQHHQRYYLHSHSFSKMDNQNLSMYPPIPDATGSMPQAYPMPPLQQSQQPQQPTQTGVQAFRNSDSPASEPSHVSNVSTQANQKPQKKNQYPCPMAKQIGCTDFFTTSGHAARHAKKHTGKKDAFCPECNKAFTRKDNMEQHRRTHQNGRGASRSANNDDSKVKKSTKAPAKKATVKASEPALEAAVEQQLADQAQAAQAQQAAQAAEQVHARQNIAPMPIDQQMLMSASGPYFLNTIDPGPIPALPLAVPDMSGRPPLQRANFTSSLDYVPPTAPMAIDPDTLHYSYPSPGLSNGLNSLALAASERGRMSENSQSRSPSSESHGQRTP